MIFFAIAGFIQVIFIIIAQYGLSVGSPYYVIFVPIGVTFAFSYSTIIIFESYTSMNKFRDMRPIKGKKKKETVVESRSWIFIRPIIFTLIGFVIFFAIGYLIFFSFIDVSNTSIIADNVGAIGTLIVANYIETDMSRRQR
jgi:hypothetical protein